MFCLRPPWLRNSTTWLHLKEFAVVVIVNAPGLYYLSGRTGFGKSHVARLLIDAFRSMRQRVAVTGTTATAAGNIGGVNCIVY